jgi:hypothetical protein
MRQAQESRFRALKLECDTLIKQKDAELQLKHQDHQAQLQTSIKDAKILKQLNQNQQAQITSLVQAKHDLSIQCEKHRTEIQAA